MIQRYLTNLGMQGDFVDSLRECYNRREAGDRISAIKAVLARHRDRIRTINRSGASGTDTVRFISEMVDTLLRVMWDHVEMSVPNEANLVAVVAVGGYGRLELCPQSDIDLLILTSEKPTRHEKEQAETIVRNLWDYGFILGHSVRSLSQCEEASTKDPETWTSFLNERFVAGDHELYRKFVRMMSKRLFPWRTTALIEAKIKEREQRKSQVGVLVQMLEPNLKEGLGCLRDVHSMMWIAKVKHDCNSFGDLVREGLITPQELEDIRVGYDFLLQVRCCLHFMTNKKDDHLGFAIQPEVAAELGFSDDDNQKAVEVFLKVFYHHTKTILRVTEGVISRWVKNKEKTSKPAVLKDHPHFQTVDGALDLKARVGNPFLDNVGLMLEYFEISNRRELGHSHHAILRIKQAVSILSSNPDLDLKSHLPDFLRLCQSRERVGRMLRTMNDVRLIGLLIPDFNYIYCHSQHDIYHIYTTDEHTITVVRQLAYLAKQTDKDLESLQKALSQVSDMELLILSCFYHDIGKGVGPQHSVSGAKMVFEYMQKMGMSASRCKEASNLVLYHLLMNEIIQRRDLDDPKTIRDFITKVETPATLHKLYVMTYCDVSSVHPDAWSSWKASLLRRLYELALTEMQSPFQAVLESRSLEDQLIENVSKRVSEAEVRRHLEMLPRQYASSTTAEDIVTHINLLASLETQKFNARILERQTHWEVTVVANDDEALLCAIAGTMAHLELSILSARIFTRVDGKAIDKFWVSIPEGGKQGNAAFEQRLIKELGKNFQLSTEELRELQTRIKPKTAFGRVRDIPMKPAVSFSNAISDSFSTVDLTCSDRIGLLFQVTKVFRDLNLDVHGAVLTTEADKAMDAFYVTDGENKKIEDAQLIDLIVTTLIKELSDT
ncbi:MAG TPA: [protein-PII] uridylyltransferase [Fibrobacteria bacterium]|nr:[protein-PII] uridylyltransferase [Fibrobacteria bacterium]